MAKRRTYAELHEEVLQLRCELTQAYRAITRLQRASGPQEEKYRQTVRLLKDVLAIVHRDDGRTTNNRGPIVSTALAITTLINERHGKEKEK